MLDKQGEKLWRKIGINPQLTDGGSVHSQEEVRSKASRSSPYSNLQWEQPHKGKQETTPVSNSVLDHPPFAPPSMPLRRSGDQLLWQEEGQTPSHPRMLIQQEESQIEQVQAREQGSILGSIDYEGLEAYHYEVSHMPESVTPLVYSKTSRKEEVRFNKQSAKAIILRIRLAQTKDLLQRVRADFLEFSSQVREEHQSLMWQICNKCFQIARDHSLRVQESVFTHKQDCQQLKYQLDVIKAKQELMRYPVDSEIIFNAPVNNNLKQENEDLKMQLAYLTEENARLKREGQNFKLKISDIQGKTAQIRQSNDKLYEYIFDLEQKIAYYKEEIPKIAERVKQETQKQMERDFQEQVNTHSEEMTNHLQQIDFLQAQNNRFAQEMRKSNDLVNQLKRQNDQMKVRLEYKQQEIKLRQLENQSKAKEVLVQEADCKRLRLQIQKLTKEREDMDQWREEQRKESSSRLSGAFSIKEDKKLIEALQIEKLVLQKENIQLKATIQFYNKNQNFLPNYAPQKSYQQPSPYQMPINHQSYQSQQNIDLKDRELEMKERQLITLQNYLEQQGRRLQNRQRDIESLYVIKRTQEARNRQYVSPGRVNIIDDYGMKKLPMAQTKHIPQRRNQFSNSQTQAIIEKVKIRQKMKENGGYTCICNDSRNCHCDTHSRGSRTSQDSNPRDYMKIHHHRPTSYSPAMADYEHLRREEKSSKIKQIEDKVRRLKSELKSSFTSLNDG